MSLADLNPSLRISSALSSARRVDGSLKLWFGFVSGNTPGHILNLQAVTRICCRALDHNDDPSYSEGFLPDVQAAGGVAVLSFSFK